MATVQPELNRRTSSDKLEPQPNTSSPSSLARRRIPSDGKNPFVVIKKNNTALRRKSFENLLKITDDDLGPPAAKPPLTREGSEILRMTEKHSAGMDKVEEMLVSNQQRMTALLEAQSNELDSQLNKLRLSFENETRTIKVQGDYRRALDAIMGGLQLQMKHLTNGLQQIKAELHRLETENAGHVRTNTDLLESLKASKESDRARQLAVENLETRNVQLSEDVARLETASSAQTQQIALMEHTIGEQAEDIEATADRANQLSSQLTRAEAQIQVHINNELQHKQALADLSASLTTMSEERVRELEDRLEAYANASVIVERELQDSNSSYTPGDEERVQQIMTQQRIQEGQLAEACAEIARLMLLIEDNNEKDATIGELGRQVERLRAQLDEKDNSMTKLKLLHETSQERLQRALDGFKKLQDQACVEVQIATKMVHERERKSDKKVVALAQKEAMESMVWFTGGNVKKRRTGPFTGEEDYALVQNYAKTPQNWVELAKKIPGRADCDIHRRWDELQKEALLTSSRTRLDSGMTPQAGGSGTGFGETLRSRVTSWAPEDSVGPMGKAPAHVGVEIAEEAEEAAEAVVEVSPPHPTKTVRFEAQLSDIAIAIPSRDETVIDMEARVPTPHPSSQEQQQQ